MEGVNIYIKHWGSTQDFEYIDPTMTTYDFSIYFKPLIDFLENKGYKRGRDIFGAPFDLRLGPLSDNFPVRFKKLIEDIYNSRGEKVVIASHSMGSRWVLESLL